jgi:hypothetical protein
MATVNFSVPDEVKEAFNQAFEGQNKSAIIAGLMRRAVDEAERRRSRAAVASGSLLASRSSHFWMCCRKAIAQGDRDGAARCKGRSGSLIGRVPRSIECVAPTDSDSHASNRPI